MTRFLERNNQKLNNINSHIVNTNYQKNLTADTIESPIFLNNINNKQNERRFVFEDEIIKINGNTSSAPLNNTNDKNEKAKRQTISVNTLNYDSSKTPLVNPNEKQCRKGFMNKQEKAFKQLSAIVFGFTLCFLPYFIVFMIVAICEDWL
jgi:hypothetical protein